MDNIRALIKHIAPNLASAMAGPFAKIARKFILDKLLGDSYDQNRAPEALLEELLGKTENLKKIKKLDKQFEMEMRELDIDVIKLEVDGRVNARERASTNSVPQIIISIIFLSAYFLMLAAIFYVESSDSINMRQGGNSLMGELQILFGVLTAGVGQILSFWFGGVMGKRNNNTDIADS